MPDKSEVIMGQMDETRKDLADKIEQLEKKVSGTVESVTDLVEKVPETVSTVKETIAETVSTVKDTVEHTVEAVKGSVEGTVGAVKRLFDIPHHVDRHPWLMMGGSVLVGFVGGRLLLPRPRTEDTSPSSAAAGSTPAAASYAAPAAQTYEPRRDHEEPQRSSGGGWLSRLTGQFGGELGRVKGLAIGSLLGMVRDAVSQWVPETLRKDATEIINNLTSDLGGQVIQGPILGQGGDGRAQSGSGSGTV